MRPTSSIHLHRLADRIVRAVPLLVGASFLAVCLEL